MFDKNIVQLLNPIRREYMLLKKESGCDIIKHLCSCFILQWKPWCMLKHVPFAV